MNTFKKTLLTLVAGSLLATTMISSVAAGPVAADPPPECRAVSERFLGGWQLQGRVCWNLHEVPGGLAGPIELDGGLRHRDAHVAAIEVRGHLAGDLVGPGPNRWAVGDITAAVATPTGGFVRDLDRRYVGPTLGEVVRDFAEGTTRVLIALLLP